MVITVVFPSENLFSLQTCMKSLLYGKYWAGVKWEDEDE